MGFRYTRGAAFLVPITVLGLVSTAAGPVPAQTQAPRPITLHEALELAKANSPLAIQARGQTRSSQAGVRSAYGAFIPNLSLSMGANRQIPANGGTRIGSSGEVITIPAEPWSYSTGVSANLELFGGGRRLYDLRQARANVTAAEANEIAQEFNVALNVKQEYFNVLAARESELAARAQFDQAEQQYRAATARVRAGSGTKSDSLRSQIQLSDARVAILEALNDIEVANAALTRAVGVDYTVTATDSGGTEAAGISLTDDELLQLAAEGPEVAQAEAQFHAAHASRLAARSAYFPSLNAGWSYGGSGTDNYGFENYRGSLRLSLSFPLFNQFNREESVVRAQVAESNAQASLRDARLAARENLTRYLGAFRTAGERVRAQEASVAAAEEDLRVQQQRYSLGASTLLDLLTSQSTLNDARRNLIRARYDQRIAKAQLEALVGREL